MTAPKCGYYTSPNECPICGVDCVECPERQPIEITVTIGPPPAGYECDYECQAAYTRGQTSVIYITSLPDTSLRVCDPIRVVTERLTQDNYVSQMPSANVNASGDTFEEAIDNLKDMIVATYDLLSTSPLPTLGPSPSQHIKILRQHIQRRR